MSGAAARHLLACLVACCAASAAADERPNFVLLMGDDHGWDETGYNGHPDVQTPVLDEMAAEGLRLDRFYAAHPTCSPTRGSVLTGRHPNRYGVFTPGWSIRPEEITIAHLLGEAGYACGHFGKWHLGPVKASSPTNPGAMGFDAWLSHDNFFEMDPVLSRNGGPPQKIEGEGSQVVIDAAIRFIADATERREPFFVVVWYGSPHEPYSGLEEDLTRYQHVRDKHPGRTIRVTSNETGLRVRRPLGEVLQERYAEITAMDRSIGSLRTALGSLGVRDNTLVWYCGDNGSPAGASITSPLREEKGSVYEGGVRVPSIIEWPERIRSARRSSLNAVTTDTLPTLCELAGAPLPRRPLDGVSLTGLIDGDLDTRPAPICFWQFQVRGGALRGLEPYLSAEQQTGTTPLVKQMAGRFTRNFNNVRVPTVRERYYAGPRSIVDGRHKLVLTPDGNGGETRELFDVRADPGETRDLRAGEPELAERLAGELRAWQKSVLTSLTGADY